MSRPAVQRWRIVYRRHGAAASLAPREETAAWEALLRATGLPIAIGDPATSRPRLQLGPPVPSGMVALEELIDIFLAERTTQPTMRQALTGAMAEDRLLLELSDVWLGAPSLPATIVAAEYQAPFASLDPDDDASLCRAIETLLAAPTLLRQRERTDRQAAFDLRPLIRDLRLEGGPAGRVLVLDLRIDQQAGSGRPSDVVAALGQAAGRTFQSSGPVVRTRLILSPG